MLAIPQRPAYRGCGDGCFASLKCSQFSTGRRRRRGFGCKSCPYPKACRNRTAPEIFADQRAIRRQLQSTRIWAPSTRAATSCAVVGSSATLLARRDGDAIDAYEFVLRVNTAPVRGFERHVGSRTDLRVWGATAPPRRLDAIAAIVPKDPARKNSMRWHAGLIRAEDTVLRYCGPNNWLGSCWKNISHDEHADPRLHPAAWRLASTLIHTNRTRCKEVGCVPSSGAMAILVALERCTRVTLFGFGVDGRGGVPAVESPAACHERVRRLQHGRAPPAGGERIAATALDAWRVAQAARLETTVAHANASAEDVLCWKGRHCEKYYMCAGDLSSGLSFDPLALPQWVRRRSHTALIAYDYFGIAVKYHDIAQEFAWLARLHRAGLVDWRGAPDPRVPSVDPCHRRRHKCWE